MATGIAKAMGAKKMWAYNFLIAQVKIWNLGASNNEQIQASQRGLMWTMGLMDRYLDRLSSGWLK